MLWNTDIEKYQIASLESEVSDPVLQSVQSTVDAWKIVLEPLIMKL
jgi:hypothetical protein